MIERKSEIDLINIKSEALKKVIYHSLIYGMGDNGFSMVMGAFGGKSESNEIIVEKAFCMASGFHYEVKWDIDDYMRISQLDEVLYHNQMFINGWYCSIPLDGSFFNETNMNCHIGYQQNNPDAFVVVVYPENLSLQKIEAIIEVYRLKDLVLLDYVNGWEELRIKILDQDEISLLDEITTKYRGLIKDLENEKKEEEHLDEFLDEWVKFKGSSKQDHFREFKKELKLLRDAVFTIPRTTKGIEIEDEIKEMESKIEDLLQKTEKDFERGELGFQINNTINILDSISLLINENRNSDALKEIESLEKQMEHRLKIAEEENILIIHDFLNIDKSIKDIRKKIELND